MNRRKMGEVNSKSGSKSQGDQVSRVDQLTTKIEKASISDSKKLPVFQYSRDTLISFKHLPSCKVRPSALDPAYNNGQGLWDPERWHYGRRRSETPTDDDGRPNRCEEPYKRRSGDPRERVRKEQDGIILSPQRRSFNSGCHVDAKSNRRPESPLNRELAGYREAASRRIGSGRILSRDVWEKSVEPQAEYFKRGASNKDRHDRRQFGQEYEREREKDHRRSEKNRYNGGDRRRGGDKEEVPEWVSGGPTTQDEQIELHGFEEDQPEESDKHVEESTALPQQGVESLPDAEEEDVVVENELEATHPVSPVSSQNEVKDAGTNADFLDDILKFDMLNYQELISNDLMAESSSGSRFSQWFKRESPAFELSQSRRSSTQDELMPELQKSSMLILPSSESDAYFAPISPAPTATSEESRMHIKPSLLLEMLQRGVGSDGGKPPSIKDLEASGKVHSVEELEAKIRLASSQQNHVQQVPAKHVDDDLVVFNKLLSRVSEGLVTTARGPNGHQSPGVDYLQMLSKSRQEYPTWTVESQVSNQPTRPAAPQQPVKLTHIQQQDQNSDLVSSLLGTASSTGQPQFLAPPGHSSSPVSPEVMSMFDSTHPSRDLLRRPEAVAIIQGLQNGQLTVKHLVHQLQNSALQLRHRDLLFSILKLYLTLGPESFPRTSPLPGPPLPEAMLLHQIFAQRPGQQQLRVPSPISGGYCHPPPIMSPNINTNPNTLAVQHSGLPHRVPSPRELVVHTQNIMQSALIKKKLEEQLENFRKRQEIQHSVSPNITLANTCVSGKGNTSPAKHLSPTPLAFTPTSVLRKMTAEKDVDVASSPRVDEQSKLHQQQSSHLQNAQHLHHHQQQQQQQQQHQHHQHHHNQQQRQQPPQHSNSVNPWGITKPPGRAIVKGNSSYHFNPNLEYHKQKHHQSISAQQQLLLQQQQRLAASFGGNCSKLGHSGLTAVQPQQINSLIMMHRTNPRGHSLATYQNHQHHQHHQRHSPSLQQYLLNQSLTNSGMQQQSQQPPAPQTTLPLPAHRVGNSSPTSDQLARWFTPELLVQAHAGQLLDMPPIPSASNILSLEELERLQQAAATAVHN